MKTLFALLFAVIGYIHGAYADEWRLFSNREGSQIEAKVLTLDKEKVTLLRKSNSKAFRLALDSLSEADQAWLAVWRPPANIRITATKRVVDTSTWVKRWSNGDTERITTRPHEYEIIVQNMGNSRLHTLNNIFVPYRVYTTNGEWISGGVSIQELAPLQRFEFITEAGTKSWRKNANYSLDGTFRSGGVSTTFSGFGRTSEQTRGGGVLQGVIVKVLQGDERKEIAHYDEGPIDKESWKSIKRFKQMPGGKYIHFDGVYSPIKQEGEKQDHPRFIRFLPDDSTLKGVFKCEGLKPIDEEFSYSVQNNSIIIGLGSFLKRYMKGSFSTTPDGHEVLRFELVKAATAEGANDNTKLFGGHEDEDQVKALDNLLDKLKWLQNDLIFRIAE